MSKEYNIEDEYQKEALTTAVEVMRLVGETRERLAAARLVLDFTKSKPASKSDVSISRAEDFLASLLQEDKNKRRSHIPTEVKLSTANTRYYSPESVSHRR